MAIRKIGPGLLVCFVLLSVLTSSAVKANGLAASSSPAVSAHWETGIWDGDLLASDISIVFAGKNEVPLFDYYAAGADRKTLAIPDDFLLGNCGPDNSWSCISIPQYGVKPKISKMAIYTFVNSFKVGWAYENTLYSDHIWLYQVELTDDLQYADFSTNELMDIPWFMNGATGWDMPEEPSLVFDSLGNPHVVLVIRIIGSTNKVIYIHKITGGAKPTNPCNSDPNTLFQCDEIYSIDGYLGLRPKIVLTDTDKPRIGFFNLETNNLMYAYPKTNILLPGNCGPANTWRCIVIDSPTANFKIFEWFDMAIGPGAPQFAYKASDPLNDGRTWIYHAKYVGSSGGGNCGEDLVLTPLPTPANVWRCTQVVKIDDTTPAYTSFSIQVDPNDYAVIAHNYENGSNYHLAISYPSRRVGVDNDSWTLQKIDGTTMSTGLNVALALNSRGLGYLAYIEDEEWDPNFKIAYQLNTIFLPIIMR